MVQKTYVTEAFLLARLEKLESDHQTAVAQANILSGAIAFCKELLKALQDTQPKKD